MKSFSFKTFALSFLVVAGSANANFADYVKKADKAIFGESCVIIGGKTFMARGGLPIFNSYLRSDYGFIRAAVVAATVAGISVAVCKAIKHFTKPAADATEGENVEAEANTEVA